VGSHLGRLKNLDHKNLELALNNQPVEEELLQDIKSADPDIILVGMGFPLQEKLISKLAGKLEHGVLIGEGGTFDYRSFGGRQAKAPKLLQRIGLEWLWRLALQPKRLRRQLAIPRFLWRLYRQG
jgi:N-acetylglucosaminyldiphosphoundecaprenol N-acetyl-beta-D-mannosaminyltransferase